MNPYLEQNLNALEKNPNHIISPIKSENQQYIVDKINDLTIISSGSDSVIESKNSVPQNLDVNFKHRGIYFIIGMQDIRAIEEIYNNAPSGSSIVVIEPNSEVFFGMIQNYNFEDLFAKDNFYLLVTDYDVTPEFISELLLKKGLITKISNIQFFINKYIQTFERKEVLNLQKQIIEKVRVNLFMIGNSTEDTMIGLLQNLLNLKSLTQTTSIKRFQNSYEGIPAIIVSAGPSLQKNLKYLKTLNRESVLIFSVDTVFKKLLKEGIIPDAVFAVERGKIVYDYFFKDVDIPDETIFVGPPVVHPSIIKKFKNDRLLLPLKYNEKVNEWMNHLISNRNDFIPMGTSVAHLAFSFARYIGCDPIIFIGQDLAYGEDGNSHSKGTVYDNIEPDKKNEDDMYVEGYFGEEVKTSRIWKNFTMWFEEEFYRTRQKVINSTEGGAKINHCEQLPFKAAIKQYATKTCPPLYKFLQDNYHPIHNNLNEIGDLIKTEVRIVQEFKYLLNSMLQSMDGQVKKQSFDKKSFQILTDFDLKYKKALDSCGFLSIFLQTHISIASFEFNKLTYEFSKENFLKTVEIQKKLFTYSKDISDLVIVELEKFLNTTLNK
ncbi:DUF115 domain-containing protein [Radiobacillus kanasensis]|uniref:motility associated factor glycosyltransferase family protein n=1 Tax=Radiobacillus kanasensis TaxID=2844358 RepID=UPI001E2C48F3|nr:6-hydroxymethylpterin diphosphokinase MptE-like protein [Radiobacillus kanasensis]UFT98543.1 DUF115 domain-containing protein [Radiobacillus kanasensis]